MWAVFDKDSFSSDSFNRAILKAKANDIYCAWSNEAFELWYLLHFHNRVTAMCRQEYKKAIEEAANAKRGTPRKPFAYKKNDNEMCQLLQKYGDETLAMKWTRELSNQNTGDRFATFNPQTEVFKLVEELRGDSKKLISEVLEKYREGK